MLKATNWQKPYISSATAKKTDVTGATGVKMTGPYEYVSPNYWLLDTKYGGAHGYNTETSPGPAVPPVESLQKMFPPDKLWPINEVWDFHAGGGQFKNIQVYAKALEERYGKAKDVYDFAWKSQATAYEGERSGTQHRLFHEIHEQVIPIQLEERIEVHQVVHQADETQCEQHATNRPRR